MINTVRIASCFEGEQERTLPILETVYQDGERLRDIASSPSINHTNSPFAFANP